MKTAWAIIEYESGHHYSMMNSLGRHGVPCIVPMVTSEKLVGNTRRTVMIPALKDLMLVPADEDRVQVILDNVRYAEKAWRTADGHLRTIPDAQVQFFLDRLEKREKKPKAMKKAMNVGKATEKDWFDLMHRNFGITEAIKRFGRDLSDSEAPVEKAA